MMQTNSSPWKSLTTSICQVINKTPEKKMKTDHLPIISKSPLPNTFKFTPTKGKKIYPTLKPPDQRTSRHLTLNSSPVQNLESNESYINKENQSFVNAMDSLQTQMFSSNISNKVLNEFSSRYEKVRDERINNIVELNNNTTNEELNKRASDRYSLTHRNRFNRMESIAFHYAAMRKERKESIQKKLTNDAEILTSEVDTEFEEAQMQMLTTPGDKRVNLKALESASKRMKLDDELNFKEITVLDSSPTKSINQKENLKNLYKSRINQQQANIETNIGKIPGYLQPTKASIQKSTSSKSISPSKSTASLKLNNSMYPTPDLHPQEPTHLAMKPQSQSQSKLTRSPSVSPTRSLSKISPSKAYSNLNKILTSSPQKMEVDEVKINRLDDEFKNPTRIPRSKTISNSKHQDIRNHEPSLLPRSSTSGSLRNHSMSTSSSIPRLAHLTNVESKVESKLKKWRY